MRYLDGWPKGKTTLIQKVSLKGTAPNNYTLITCLPMVWKILPTQIKMEICYSLITRGLFLKEQKGSRKRTRGIKEQLNTDQKILNESKTRGKNLTMPWIDNKKKFTLWSPKAGYYTLKMYTQPEKVIQFIETTMETWRMELTAGGRSLHR